MNRLCVSVLLSAFLSVTSSLASASDRAHLLSNSREALNARVSLITSGHAPFLSAFEIAEDRVGLTLLGALLQSARQGGHPKLLIDALGHRLTHDMIRYLIQNGVEVRLFRASYLCSIARFGVGELLQRMHNKILTDGGDLMITGGRNSRDPFFGLDHNLQNFIDYDILVSGPSARAARAYQEQMWNSPLVQMPYQYLLPSYIKTGITNRIIDAIQSLRTIGFLDVRSRNFESSLIPAEISFIHNEIKTDGSYSESSVSGAARALIDAIDHATKQILIDSQYLILTPEMERAFSRAVRRGVHVEIATNGSRAFSTPADGIERDAFEMFKPRLRATGVTVREYQGPGKIHSKAAVIDRATCFVWSFNLDPRSQEINYEAGARIASREICGSLADNMITHMRSSLVTIRAGRTVVPDRVLSGVERALIETIQAEL